MWKHYQKGVFTICTLRAKREFTYDKFTWENIEPEKRMEDYIWRLVQVKDIGKRKQHNGSKFQQFYGLLVQGELGMRFGQPLKTLEENDGYDGGIDLVINGHNIDIKTTLRTVDINPEWPANLLDCQYKDPNSKTDYYLFCSYNTAENTFQILGILNKQDVEKVGTFFGTKDKSFNNAGRAIKTTAERWEIPIASLVQVNSLEDIKDYFK